MNTYIKYDDYKEEVVKNNISLSIKGKVQLFLFLLCKYYFILIQLIVDEATIDRNNRWRKIEKAGARKANLSMRDHYAEVLVSLRSFLKYSQAL